MAKQSKQSRELLADSRKVVENIRQSVVYVLLRSEMYKDLAKDPQVVSSITDSVVKASFNRVGNKLVVKNQGKFKDIVESIKYNTDKVIQITEAKEQIKNAASVIAHIGEDADSLKLQVLHASVVDKLDEHSSKDLDFFESNFKKTVQEVVYAGSELNLTNLPPRKDLLYLDMILVAAGTNTNKDTILEEELNASYLTLIGMPLVEEHIPDAIRGVYYDSKLVRIKPGKTPGSIRIVEKGGRVAVRAKAYLYRKRFPREAAMLINRQEQGMLRYSVELGFQKAECSECGKQFTRSDPYCEHLLLRSNPNVDFRRIVRGIFFVGGSYTMNPAEKDAVSLEVKEVTDSLAAKKQKNDKNNENGVNIIEETTEIPDTLGASNNKKSDNRIKNTLGNTQDDSNGGKRMFEFDTIEDLMGNDTVQALIESKVSDVVKEEREMMEAAVDEFESSKKTLEEEVAALKTKLAELNESLEASRNELKAMESEKRVSSVIADLLNNGYKFGSDTEVKAFSDRIRDKSEEDISFIVDLMKKSVVTATAATAEPTTEGADPDLTASTKADNNGAAVNTSSIASVRKSWAERIEALRN